MFNFGSRIFLLAFPCGLISIASLCIVVVAADWNDVCVHKFEIFARCVPKKESWMYPSRSHPENGTVDYQRMCSHWEIIRECAQGISGCEINGRIWSTLRDDSLDMVYLYHLCGRSSPCPRASLATLLPITLLAGLIVSVATYA